MFVPSSFGGSSTTSASTEIVSAAASASANAGTASTSFESTVFSSSRAVAATGSQSPEDVSSCWELVVAVRDRPHLIYVNCNSLEQKEVSFNENEWDKHVSFTPLHLSLSPNMKWLLVSTNKGQHLIYRLGSNKRLRILASHDCNDYGKPGTAWDPTGKYIYSLSDSGYKVLVYSVASERVVGWLIGHSGAVRSVVCHPITREVVTASFDKSVRVWDASE